MRNPFRVQRLSSRPAARTASGLARRLSIILLLAIAVAASAVLGGCGLSGSDDAADRDLPNIIVITIDDATYAQVNRDTMPETFAALADRGTTFRNFIVPMPLCCPSRAAYITGQYGHNNKVLRNDYRQLREKGNVLPRWLQQGGYRTVHVGKYLNNYESAMQSPEQVPWGWDVWYTLLDNGYFNYRLTDGETVRKFGDKPKDYATYVINDKSVEMIQEYAADDEKPMYLQIDHYAPHPHVASGPDDGCRGGATAPPDRGGPDEDTVAPQKRKASANEEDVSDKPWFVKRLERMAPGQRALRERNYRCAVAALRAVDTGVGQLVEALDEEGVLGNTLIALTSDNGFFYGEHRIPANKEFPYEENLRMPLLLRLPDQLRTTKTPKVTDAPTGNIDLAPTLLDITGAEPCEAEGCREIDGRSLMPVLTGEGDWPEDRALLVELDQNPNEVQKRPRPCAFEGVRQDGWIYVEHRYSAAVGGVCEKRKSYELYDLENDPLQIDNLAGDPDAKGVERRLARKLDQLRDCAGTGPDAENPCD